MQFKTSILFILLFYNFMRQVSMSELLSKFERFIKLFLVLYWYWILSTWYINSSCCVVILINDGKNHLDMHLELKRSSCSDFAFFFHEEDLLWNVTVERSILNSWIYFAPGDCLVINVPVSYECCMEVFQALWFCVCFWLINDPWNCDDTKQG